ADALVGIPGTEGPNHAPTPSTEPGVDKQSINSFQARLVWQITPKTKLSGYNDRLLKNRGSAMVAGFDPATASQPWNSPIYTTAAIKMTSAVTSRVLVEAGVSTNYERYNIIMQPGIQQVRGTPAWFTNVNKNDSALGTQWNAAQYTNGQYPDRFAVAGSVSYVTGAHNIKVGMQDTWGRYRRTRESNGDLRAYFNNGVAFQAMIGNTPLDWRDN